MLRSSLLPLSLLFFSGSWIYCQKLSLQKEIVLQSSPTAYSVDIQENFYVGFEDGSMLKFDSEGKQLSSYSFPNQSGITLIEAQNSLKTFLFYFDTQQIITLDRFNTIPKVYDLSDYDVNLALSACPSPDEHFWVIENNPMRIKKIDPLRKATLLEVQVALGDSIRFMRAYKNLLIILSDKELHTFDLFGSKLHSFENIDASYFQIKDEDIMLLSGNKLLTINPFSSQIENKVEVADKKADTYLSINRSDILFKEHILLIYR